MKKRTAAAVAIMIMLLLAGCGQKNEAPVTVPKATPEASATEIPKTTEAPKTTGEPRATAAPVTTGAPKATATPQAAGTEVPTTTEKPKETAVPSASTAPVTTEAPKATATPQAAVTGTPKATEAPQKTETSGTTEVSQEDKGSSAPAVTEEPKPTEAPKEETPAPAATEEPKPTEEPKEEPSAPAATEEPKPTEAPAATEAPEVCQHDMQEFVFIEPTCQSIGDGCEKCSKCGYTENWHSIPQLEHDFEDDVIPGNCVSPAWHRYTCKNCGLTETAIGETDMNNHCNIKEVEYTGWDEETGKTITYRAVKCMDCNTVFEEYEISRELIVE